MKLAQIEQGGQTILCARTAEGLIPLNGVGYHTMMDAIERIDELPRALEMAEAKETPLAPEDARFLPVVSRPGMTFNLDGELHDMDRAFCRMLPGALTLHLPDED